jgi:hypothetical protein
MSLLAAVGAVVKRIPVWLGYVGSGLFLGAVCLVQLSGVLQTNPYYLNYYNPLLGGDRKAQEVMLVGWGEGLDQAARYLNEKPGAEGMKIYSWSADGCFSYFFKGSAGTIDYDMDVRNLRRGDYVVFYLNQLQRQAPSDEILDYFAQFDPEHVVRIGNLDYAWIYDMQAAPALPESGQEPMESTPLDPVGFPSGWLHLERVRR